MVERFLVGRPPSLGADPLGAEQAGLVQEVGPDRRRNPLLGVTRCGKETTMAKVIGWIVCCAFGIMVGAGIIYAASEFVDTVADYRDNQ
jgi:hypothetical protein